jgi:hypothetical protein
MAGFIRFVLSNFSLTLLIIGLAASGISLIVAPRHFGRPAVVEALFSWFLMFSIGVSFLYNFFIHTFFGAMAARFIGWPNSPFQTEVGFASLGYAAVGFLAWRGRFGLRLAAVVGPGLFLLGAAAGHIYQIITTGNEAPGNAGVILYMDILIPAAGFLLLWAQHSLGVSTAGQRACRSGAD